jgi:hypothetical protein
VTAYRTSKAAQSKVAQYLEAFDANGGAIGLEILDASRHMPVPPTIDLEIVTPAAE